ncbi:unnamed protein product [Coffea canephora]|uniref:Uncharacterized protein n=1 Tax=Coffea canephora TaxID=49390 RepID=A0A068UK92_COFCA|nr:unnamed protein product [Coffea canephora]
MELLTPWTLLFTKASTGGGGAATNLLLPISPLPFFIPPSSECLPSSSSFSWLPNFWPFLPQKCCPESYFLREAPGLNSITAPLLSPASVTTLMPSSGEETADLLL